MYPVVDRVAYSKFREVRDGDSQTLVGRIAGDHKDALSGPEVAALPLLTDAIQHLEPIQHPTECAEFLAELAFVQVRLGDLVQSQMIDHQGLLANKFTTAGHRAHLGRTKRRAGRPSPTARDGRYYVLARRGCTVCAGQGVGNAYFFVRICCSSCLNSLRSDGGSGKTNANLFPIPPNEVPIIIASVSSLIQTLSWITVVE